MPTLRDTHARFEPVLSTEAMRQADRQTIEEGGLPGLVLMETAGRGAAGVIETRYGPIEGKRVLVLAGKGNNGGDGLVVARVLYGRGASVHVIALAEEDAASEETATNLRLFHQMAEHDATGRLTLGPFEDEAQLDRARADLVIDALLGIGVTGALREPVRTLAAWANRQAAPVVALDVPSGLASDDGAAAENTIHAACTVTMGALKTGLLVGDGPACTGEVEVVDIGIPPHVLEAALEVPGSARRSTDRAVRTLLPRRPHDAHKYTAGRVTAVVGSRPFPGAAVMAAQAAARTGAGAVVVCTPRSARPIVETKLTEVMTQPVAETAAGTLARESLDALREKADGADAVLVGCGIGKDEATQALVRDLLPRLDAPLVLDADGLNALAGHTDLIRDHAAGRWVLTPHFGEFRRLAGRDDLRPEHRLRLAAEYAARWNCVLLIKGMPSVVGCPDGRVYVGGTGHVALATAGTGDVLAGMTAGLLAQGLEPAAAAVCALHLGTRAADRWAADRSARTMLATDLLDLLPYVLAD